MGNDSVKVWDPFVRIFHWSVVLAFAIAYVTGDELLAVHVWTGYLVAGLVVLRIIWGFVGPRHARFSDFVVGPSATLDYLRGMLRFTSKRYLGHSPAGGTMVIALLLGLSILVGTGMITHAVRNHAGPLAGFIAASSTTNATTVSAETRRFDGTRAPKTGALWKNIHEMIANLVLVLAGLHIVGVLFASFSHRENLIRAMITGRKATDPH